MTREEAKAFLDSVFPALSMKVRSAIKVLEQEPCEDCISRQAAIDCLTATGLKQFDFILDARYKIKNLPSVTPKQRWIPVSERLPEEYCLFCDIDGDVFYGHICDGRWWAEGQDDRIKNVIAWMPLPEPYKAESEG